MIPPGGSVGTGSGPPASRAQKRPGATQVTGADPEPTTGEIAPNNLPLQVSSFVGRERETARILGLLADHRLLTLTGPGGSGKTRLALVVATELQRDFEDGVWLVDLAPLSDPDLVPQAVVSTLRVRETAGSSLVDALVDHLRPRNTLLVLDNCEHVVETCAGLAATMLGACPGLRILATSREVLGVPGETLFAVPPLSLPDPRRPPAPEDQPEYEAVRLFVERARAVRQDFTLDETNSMAVVQICYRLDGMPLAIELAAARARVLSLKEISSRLKDSFALLTGGGRTAMPRQRPLRATIEWSYDLLDRKEKLLFRRLSVFAGGFALSAATAVGSEGGIEQGEVLDLLTSLVDKSLVSARGQEEGVRYRLLETVRQYGLERLEESGESADILRRHAVHYLAVAEEVEAGTGKQGARLRRLETEQGNFRSALGWALDTDRVGPDEAPEERAAVGLRLAVALGQGRFWAANGLSEGLRWLEKGLASSGDTLPESVRAAALNETGWIATVQGDREKAVALLEDSFALSKRLGDESGVAASLVQLGQLLTISDGDPKRVADLRGEAETLRSEIPEPSQEAYLVMFMALASWHGRDEETALQRFEEALGLFRNLGNLQGAAFCLGGMGFLRLARDGPAQASGIFDEALHILRTLRDRVGIYHCLLGAASVMGLRGNPVRAARLWGAAEALGETAAVPLVPLIRARYDYEGHLDTARMRLARSEFEAAWSEGRGMSPEQAIEYALENPPTPEYENPIQHPAGLSAREVEVLRLVAKGMTNARIAQKLFISPRTVNGHLTSAYKKTGSAGRVEAARFASEHGLL